VNLSSTYRGKKKKTPLDKRTSTEKKKKCNREYEIEKMHELQEYTSQSVKKCSECCCAKCAAINARASRCSNWAYAHDM
jgi:hypothetical protein